MADDVVICAEGLGKKYVIGHAAERERYVALRDVVARSARSFWRKTADMARGRAIVAGDTVEEFWAFRDVSFAVRRGEVLGIIGRNGAGKSTLLKILSRITDPSEGKVTIKGRVASLLEVGTGFHPELTGRENIYLNGAILGMTRAEIRKKFDEIVAFAEIEQFLDTPVKRYSSGMYVRLAFSVAAHLEPEILVVDEVLAVGDGEFQKKCLAKMDEVSRYEDRTVLFVSHNMHAIRDLCSRAILLEEGRVKRNGTATEVIESYFSIVSPASEIDLTRINQSGPQNCTRLRRLCVLNEAGKATTTFTMNEAFLARIQVEITKPTRKVEVGLKISSRYGIPVHNLTSSWEGLAPDLAPGLYWFEVRMPSIALYPGTYLIGLWAKRGREWADAKAWEITSILVLEGNMTGHPTWMKDYADSGNEVYTPSEWKLLS